MHKKLADKGLVVITVSVDEPNDKEKVEAANAFLRKVQPPFVNLLLNEPHQIWSKNFEFTIPPYYFIFDRRGKSTRFNPNDFDGDELHKTMDKAMIRMIAEN